MDFLVQYFEYVILFAVSNEIFAVFSPTEMCCCVRSRCEWNEMTRENPQLVKLNISKQKSEVEASLCLMLLPLVLLVTEACRRW
jgi:hypothetical protein